MNLTKRVVAVILILIATGLLSLLPDAKIETLTHSSYNFYTDLAQHSLYYLALTMFSCWLFAPASPWKIGVSLFSLSLILEIAQHFSPNRSFSIHDIISNFTGLLVGTLVVIVYRSRRKTTRMAHQ